MAQSEAATTRPARKRVAPAKAAPTTSETAPATAVPEAPTVAAPALVEAIEKIPVVLELAGRTKRYDRWEVVPGQDVTGALYVPIGSTEVRALLIVPKVS